jgi:short-subunit dehydrogenase
MLGSFQNNSYILINVNIFAYLHIEFMNAVITGATKGIGRACAIKFAENKSNLALCSRSYQDLAELKNELKSLNPSLDIYIEALDVSDKNSIQQFAKNILNHFNTLDVLVNNAGVYTPGNILEEEEGALENLIQTNLYSAYHLTRLIAPKMKAARNGHIFNLCSIASLLALPNGGSYSISKFALLGFSKVLREELKPYGVKVTSILPGATWSSSWAGVDLPAERLMEANDIADIIWQATQLSASACVEEIILRPQLGDL